ERYASTDRKKEVFSEIAATINASGVCATQIFTEDDVRTQWKNLKDTFKRKLKKRQADVDAGIEDAEPTWRFWSKMLFIRHECHHDAPSASINASVNTENSFPEMTAVDTPPHSLESLLSLVEKQISDESSNSIDGNGTSPDLGNASTSVPQNSYPCEATEINSNHSIHSPEETDVCISYVHFKKQLRGVASHSPIHPSATALTRLRRKALKRKTLDVDGNTLVCAVHPKADFEDEYTWFGRSVANSLRRLSDNAPIVSLTLKKQISDLIYEAELKQLMRSQKAEDA
ncbi:unnamed protein product, partial [Toxocara canis]|uniref:MADF domain-containing protein n=1 Tax=Toxocara canis TaxID=6265 RepID=A0A183UTM2_TOXCA